MSQDVVSFVLRFVREMGEDQEARWRGVIKHVQGNSESHFTQFSEAMEFMQTRVNELIETSFEETTRLNEENPFVETARLWGEFMPRYTKLMMDSMGEAMSGRSQTTQQMEQAMNAALAMWGLPTQQDQERTAASLKAMTTQVTELVSKIEQLEAHLAELKKNES